LAYFGLIFNEPILRTLFEHNLFELALFILQGLIYYYTLTGQNTKKIPPAFTRGGFDDDERTVDIASTTYILAYFLT